ncbi:hypothetical protein D3C81_1700950 [compost metagenome]
MSNNSPVMLAEAWLSVFLLRSRTIGEIHASMSGVMVPGPPKMFSGTQPAMAAHAAGSPSAWLMCLML